MSKRIANCRGKTTARFGRIRIGHWKRRMLEQMDTLAEADAMGKLEAEAKEKLENLKTRVKAIIPKKVLRRHQSR